MMHNLFCNNCHSHVASVLNKYKYNGRNDYNMIDVWMMTIRRSQYVGWRTVIQTYIGFIVMACFILLIMFL